MEGIGTHTILKMQWRLVIASNKTHFKIRLFLESTHHRTTLLRSRAHLMLGLGLWIHLLYSNLVF